MRRVVTAVVLAATLAAGSLSAGASADPGLHTLDSAWADWTVPTKEANRFKWYFGIYHQYAGMNEKPRPFVTLGKGVCVRTKTKQSTTVKCHGRAAPSLKRKDWDYSADPALTEARLVVRRNGRHTIDWSARKREPAPSIFTAEGMCENGTAQGGGIFRFTRAVGHLHGKHFKPRRWFDFSFLMSGVLVSTCPGYVDIAERLQAGRSITITRTL